MRDEISALVRGGMTEEEAFRQASADMGEVSAIGDEFEKVRRPGRTRFMPGLIWNYLKVSSRKLSRQKAYSLITLIGLTTGMAAFILIVLFCRFERSYDDFHRNGDRIYRVQNDRIYSARHDRSAGCPPGLGPALKEEFPEIADFARLLNLGGDPNIVSRTAGSEDDPESAGRTVAFFERRIFFADPAFLRIFSFPFVRGNAATALGEPEAAVLTESMAQKYFNEEDPLGQTITITTRFGRLDYRVSGVCRDFPPNSHLKFDLLLSFRKLAALWPSTEEQPWSSNAFLTYLLLSSSTNPAVLEAKFPLLVEKHSLDSAELKREFHLQPLRTIHLTSRLRFEAEVNGEIKTVRFLEIIGLFILLVAWVNFINLATARSLQRGKEVCVRKTLGARRRQLTGQFLFESVFLNILAFLLALTVVLGVLPFFSRLVGKPLSPAEEAQQAFFIDVDDNYFRFFSIPLVCGRGFSSGYVADKGAVVINEEMVNVLGFESAEEALLQKIVLGGFGGDVVEVVGVVRNYHHLSLREKIEPVIYLPLPQTYFRRGYFLSLRLERQSIGPAISSIAEKWKEIFPGQPLEYAFLDDEFNGQYDADNRFGQVFSLSSLLAVLIACLGLFGLASFSAERRTRKNGIRKVFGASVPEITRMLTSEFMCWVLLANLIAWPVTWIIMSKWLQRFAYRTTVGFWPLGLAALFAAVIALATVSYKAIRSAAANPADSIRYE
ncbi:MAG: ABC transporter permease [Candidatus Aminicenantales bacterium]